MLIFIGMSRCDCIGRLALYLHHTKFENSKVNRTGTKRVTIFTRDKEVVDLVGLKADLHWPVKVQLYIDCGRLAL